MSNNENPLISICVVTYNQQFYIVDAINSFLNQKFNGRLEIVIGEDCSTDNTREVLETFKQNYPDTIRLITSENNVGAQRNFTRVLQAAKGDYIAICDGDDYWLDEFKIQKQLDALTRTGCDLCFTKAQKVKENIAIGNASSYGESERIFSLSQVIRGGGGFIPSPTIFISRAIVNSLPDWYAEAPVGDFYLQILSSGNGAVYLPDITAAYRVKSEGSWSKENTNSLSSSRILKWIQGHDKALTEISNLQQNKQIKIDIEKHKSYLYLVASQRSLKIKNLELFINHIKKSWSINSFLSIRQVVLLSIAKIILITKSFK